MQAQEGFSHGRTQSGHGESQLNDAAGIAAISDHLVNARGAQPRVPVQNLAHELQLGIDVGRPQGLAAMEAVGLDGVAYGVFVNPQLAGNRADLPMLGVKVTTNLDVAFPDRSSGSLAGSWYSWERIDKTATPSAEDAAQQPDGLRRWPTSA